MTDLQIITEKLKWLNDTQHQGYPNWKVEIGTDGVVRFMGTGPGIKGFSIIQDSKEFQPHIAERLEYLLSRGFTANDYRRYAEKRLDEKYKTMKLA